MRKVLMTCMALLSVPAGSVLAQQAVPTGSTVDVPRPAGLSSTGVAPSVNPLPDTGAGSGGGMTGLRPMRGQPKQAIGMSHFTHKPPTPARSNGKRRGSPATHTSATHTSATHTSAFDTDGGNAPHTGKGAPGSV